MSTRSDADGITFVAGMLAPVALVLLIAPFALIRAFVLTKLWGWYIASYFGLPLLNMTHAYGLMLIVGFCAPLRTESKVTSWGMKLSVAAIAPFTVLLSGWIGTLFF
ncbi:MAG: hypothetical protein ACRYHQ_20125 [Janthinobacterium lividum]